ncbi:outer membrane protein assembly factor BamE [Edwardsiella piscicida]|nr:outer membrane protein assembly factor BamE [Edwardsiella piscicida]
MNRLIASVFFISVSFTSGCSTSGNQHLKTETSQSLQSQITKNKTTKSEITALLGEPDTRTTLDNGNEEWAYFMNNNQFDATTFIPIVGLLTGGSQTQAKRLEIEFKDETVRKWTFSENNSKMKTGLIQ